VACGINFNSRLGVLFVMVRCFIFPVSESLVCRAKAISYMREVLESFCAGQTAMRVEGATAGDVYLRAPSPIYNEMRPTLQRALSKFTLKINSKTQKSPDLLRNLCRYRARPFFLRNRAARCSDFGPWTLIVWANERLCFLRALAKIV